MSVKNSGRPQIKITHEGKSLIVDWSELAKMTSIALKNVSSGPGLLDTGEWKSDLDRLEWFSILKATVDKHIQTHGSDSEKTITPDIRNALLASQRLKDILTLGYVTKDNLQFLPIELAAIARTVNTANKIKAKPGQQRPAVDRRGPLTIAIEQAVRRATDEATISIYHALKKDDKVERREGDKVYYYVGDDLRDVTWGRFGVIVSDARKAKANGLRRRISKNPMG